MLNFCSKCRKKIDGRKDIQVLVLGELFCSACHRDNTSGLLRLRFKILDRDNFTCQYCGRSAPGVILEVDHRIPVKIVGRENWEEDGIEVNFSGHTLKYEENLITACWECNHGKGDILLKKYYETKEKSQ